MTEKRDAVELDIRSLAAGGRGIGRVEGKVWMVDGAVPGDRVLAEPVRERRRLVEGRVVRILEPSPDRREPGCSVQSRCGGCPWMVLDEPVQRRWKREVVRDSLERIGRQADPPVSAVSPSPLALGYRGKAEFSLGSGPGGIPMIGFREQGRPGRLVDVDRCPVLAEPANRVLTRVRNLLGAPDSGGGAGKVDPRGRRLVLRYSVREDRVLVLFRGTGRAWAVPGETVGRLARLPEVAGVVALTGTPGRRGGATTRVLAGRGHLEESVGGNRFRVPAAAFFQVNPGAATILVEQVLDMAGPLEPGAGVLDLYGGVGVFARALADRGARVTVVEADPLAVETGGWGSDAGRGPRYVREDVGRFLLPSPLEDTPRIVVANPPRTGFGPGVAAGIVRLAAPKVILVSCDPGTLARDLVPLVEGGYRLVRTVPVDLFPQTAHVETVSLLRSGPVPPGSSRPAGCG